ncbi:MAG: hypothetical protein CL578_22385 [Alteromonadaceae bacterium]|jgi:hypothetical protein|uniref:hypothetical protein n=1 Tax=unclassified Methylophaga TaxID=2629249 RepID=UPI000C3DDB15|nr:MULTISPECIES: hypothetical protein [unclassified Methylophaga]MAP27790.1 hypothetical protein [Methylophaga sp.]MBN27776.1 hypothetical protein [Alteromonadaceae bacterium]HAD31524.1 hypothetical protein [Methylophaga sp.]HCN99396.1 hypothetical protein [Methylophaga sp.]|tara:strand:- start:21076 stop:21534 length:459 start_codon:yes stop_codon:yes gene_type:complete
MSVLTSTGTILSVVADEPATIDAAGFGALTFVEVGEVTDIPEYGPNVQVVEHNPLKTGVTQKFKGFINYGSTALQLAQDVADAGQVILSDGVTGSTKNDEHSFSIEYQDGSIDYFTGKVFSYTTNPGSANSMVGSTASVEINSIVVRVLPTP